MKWIKLYENFDDNISIEKDVEDIFWDLEGFKVEISFWVNGTRGGFLASDESGAQKYGPIADNGKLYLKVEVKKIEPPGNFLTKDGFNWIETKSYFNRLRSFHFVCICFYFHMSIK
jgi:hypothetical protein